MRGPAGSKLSGMPHEHAQFDETVLEMIENSPAGAVPHTPAYDDALKRLAAARKIYPDADHRDGWATARSLARLPAFHAANWEEFTSGKITAELLESNASIFNRYAAFLQTPLRPRAEALRLRVAGKPVMHRAKSGTAFHDPIHSLFLVPGTGPNRGLPGNYLYGSVIQLNPTLPGSGWAVDVHDVDDGVALFDAADLATAATKLQEVIDSAPFHLDELEGLGFRLAE